MKTKNSQPNRSKRRPSSLKVMDKVAKFLPQDLDNEEKVLGALMLEEDAITTVIDILKPKSFYKEAHQKIYQAIVQLFNEAQPVDLRTVVNQLQKNGQLEVVGGSYYVTFLTTQVRSDSNLDAHARVIAECAAKRVLTAVATEVNQSTEKDTFEPLEQNEPAAFKSTDNSSHKNYNSMRSMLGEAFKELEAKKHYKDGITGIPSGFTSLDRITSGWQKASLVIVAARPGMGKTSFLLTTLRNAAIDYGQAVAIFSLEMTSQEVTNRLISAETEIEAARIKDSILADHEWERLVHKTAQLSKAPIYIDDTPLLSISELRAKCYHLKANYDIQLIAIDYVQLMSGDAIKGASNREQEISAISRSLKGLAKELRVTIIVGSQLSRAVESRGGNKKPQLSDLRESGALEQDADIVMFLYRPEYYGMTEDEEGNSTHSMAELIVAKHRNGPIDYNKLKFIGKYTKFVDQELANFSDIDSF